MPAPIVQTCPPRAPIISANEDGQSANEDEDYSDLPPLIPIHAGTAPAINPSDVVVTGTQLPDTWGTTAPRLLVAAPYPLPGQ